MSEKINSVTVLMPVYNDSKYLEASVKSILNQTHSDFEFIIVDDGSEDNPEKIIDRFKDTRIKFLKTVHRGLASALNFGMKNSSGEWIARIDADDLNPAERLKHQLEFLNSNPESDVISGWSVYFNENNKIIFSIEPALSDKEIKKFLDLHNPVNHSAVIFRKERIMEAGGYNEKFYCFEDFELWLRLKDKAVFRIIPEYLVYTRLRKNSLSRRSDKKMIYDLLIKNALSNFGKAGDSSEKTYWNEIAFWVEYFYGEKKRARKYIPEKSSLKNYIAYLSTFMPHKLFEESKEWRLKQRIEMNGKDKKKFNDELTRLLK